MNIELTDLSSVASKEIRFQGIKRDDASDKEEEPIVEEKKGMFAGLNNIFGGFSMFKAQEIDPNLERVVRLDGTVQPQNNFSNAIDNRKYTVMSFVPVVLYNQFKYFFNMFFLLLALSQFVDALKVGLLFSFVAPLVFVLTMTLLKEGSDDLKRYMRDKELNGQQYRKLDGTGFKEITAAEIKVGHIIEVKANQRIPADLVLLYTNDQSGTIFIRTDQLDGETDWKIRKPIQITHSLVKAKKNIASYGGGIRQRGPNKEIYEYAAVFEGDDQKTEPLNLENALWCNTVLCSGKILALVVYTGKETRMEQNAREPRTKRGSFDSELNLLSKYLFGVMVVASFLLVLLSGFQGNMIIQTIRFVILLSCIIPVSLRVNLDFSKIVFSWKISNDINIEGAVARNSEIPEELGRIQFILTDKTGTLTQNEMIFKTMSMEHFSFSFQEMEQVKKALTRECKKGVPPMHDVFERLKKSKKRYFRREQNQVLRDMITAITVCHNVTPVDDENGRIYQASSPDEVALVKLAESLGFRLETRDQRSMKVMNIAGQEENYEILENFPFTSESKRMGILVRHRESGNLLFYLKGADSALKPKVPEIQRGFLMDECENLAREGLRTLVISQKAITANEYERWKELYNKASSSLDDRANKMYKVLELLEKDMEFLGITGVEDKLQEDVRVSIESLRNAGIQIWMLTGDKIETACCIAISTSLKTPQQEFFVMRDMKEKQKIEREINDFGNSINNRKDLVLVIDGQSLATAIEYSESLFFSLACRASTVICCRCSPTQKAYVTDRIKFYTGAKTLGIGDGGNDVGMITTADVGVGIVGKEGKQAALSSDFSILRFKDVTNLLLWHGRNSYKRGAVMAQFVIHRGLIISVIQIFFSATFYYLPVPVYNGMLMLGYSTVYTMLPVFALIFDSDVDLETALKYPPLYKSLQKGKELNRKTALIWLWMSIYQGAVIMMLSIICFNEPLFNIVTITFTSLICIELLNVFSEVSRPCKAMVITCSLSVLVYAISSYFCREYLALSEFSLSFVFSIGITVAVAWLPLYLIKVYMFYYHPTEDQKIMMQTGATGDEGCFGYFTKCFRKLKFWQREKAVDVGAMKELMDMDDMSVAQSQTPYSI